MRLRVEIDLEPSAFQQPVEEKRFLSGEAQIAETDVLERRGPAVVADQEFPVEAADFPQERTLEIPHPAEGGVDRLCGAADLLRDRPRANSDGPLLAQELQRGLYHALPVHGDSS